VLLLLLLLQALMPTLAGFQFPAVTLALNSNVRPGERMDSHLLPLLLLAALILHCGNGLKFLQAHL
jgi:hypothetical protein